jgi:hypothetical protein
VLIAFPDAKVYTALPADVSLLPEFVVGDVIPRSTRGRAMIGKQHSGTLIVYDHQGQLLLWRVLTSSNLEEERLFEEIRAAYSLTRPRELS